MRNLLGSLGDRVVVSVPAARDRESLLAALGDAEIVVGDWSGGLALDAEAVRAAPRLAFVQQPSVGVDGHDLAALAEAGVPLANTAGVSAIGVAEWCLAAALGAVAAAARRRRRGPRGTLAAAGPRTRRAVRLARRHRRVRPDRRGRRPDVRRPRVRGLLLDPHAARGALRLP
ncbi:hypothetical protein GCM10018952_73970 [Streptosporangium vulgare]